MQKRLNIAFVWQGVGEKAIYGQWGDGLRAAMTLIEKEHNVTYFEPWQEISGFDVILYWEAPVTYNGKNGEFYRRIQSHSIPKILLFAGGVIKEETCGGFDLFLVESRINEEEFDAIGKPWMRAFGVDIEANKPEMQPKIWDGVMPATCAGWKRQILFSEALGEKGVLCGRNQDVDFDGFILSRKKGTMVFPEMRNTAVNALYNASWACVNTSSEWGGGQRITLEAMSAGIPVVVMSDSPKNREYVEESGAGLVVEPSPVAIRRAIEEIKKWTPEERARGRAYVEKKWTHVHYKDAILEGIKRVLKQ